MCKTARKICDFCYYLEANKCGEQAKFLNIDTLGYVTTSEISIALLVEEQPMYNMYSIPGKRLDTECLQGSDDAKKNTSFY